MTHDIPRAGHEGPAAAIELWGGHECTVHRIGDAWFDQSVRSGHHDRIGDLALFADLGLRSLRYPALWERIAPDCPDARDFSWTDERLAEIARLGLNPILTLCHHGSGPRYTSLLDDGFAAGLAAHARSVARRYPWVRDYTPVNEPLTTARFSALYGFWYPHLRDERAFWIALLNEIDATRLAMRAIRAVQPAARLIQTDDLGFCHASPPLAREAAFQNDRRWMTWDLLCGRVVPGHALWARLVAHGIEPRLRAIADDPCPPDIIGINHYLSSERLIDHRINAYGARAPADQALGDSGGIALVDVDAVRHRPEGVVGLSGLLRQCWDRYRLPIAITECHNGGTRDEQVRWIVETWRQAEAARARGIDIRAVTAWALLGSYDWNRMLTRCTGHYEPGIFDVRTGRPRPTLAARVLKDLAAGRAPDAPGLDVPGSWRRHRHFGAAARRGWTFRVEPGARAHSAPRPLLIVDGDHPLIPHVIAACERRGLCHSVEPEVDETTVRAAEACAVIDLRDPQRLRFRADRWSRDRRGMAPAGLALACARMGISGAALAAPGVPPCRLAIRHGTIYAAEDDDSWPARVLDALDAGEAVAIEGATVTLVYAPDLADTLLDLLLDDAGGAIDLGADDPVSAAHFARLLAEVAGHEPDRVAASDVVPVPATGSHLPPLVTCLERFVRDRRAVRGRRPVQPAPVEIAEAVVQAAE